MAETPLNPVPSAEGKATDTNATEQQTLDLPEDPFDERRLGGLYLRLTNECPPEGIRLVLVEAPKIVENDRFKDKSGKAKQEYHWPIYQYLEGWQPIDKILVESRPAFRRAVVGAMDKTKGETPYGIPLRVRWVKEKKNANQERSVFIVSKISPEEIAGNSPQTG